MILSHNHYLIASHNQIYYNMIVGLNQTTSMLSYFIVILSNPETGDRVLCKLSASSKEEAAERALESNSSWQVDLVKYTRGGSRPGAGRVSKWGDGVVTERYRLPKNLGDNAEKIVDSIEGVCAILESWESKVQQSISASASGQPSERYKYVAQLCSELRSELSSLPDSLV